jgi:two-component system, sporulation sensor kinase E
MVANYLIRTLSDPGGTSMIRTSTHALSNLMDFISTCAHAVNAGMLYLDGTLRVTVFNDLARDLLNGGIAVGESAPLAQCLEAEREEYQLLAETVQSGEALRDKVVAWEVAGQLRHVLVDSYPLPGEDCPGGMLVMIKDLGNLATLEQNIQRTEKLATVGKIAAGIAHEIRNPLTTVKGFLQVLEERLVARDMLEETGYVRLIMDEIHRVNGLVSELLLLSKPRQAQKEPCHIEDILNDLEPIIEAETLLRSVEFTLSIAPDAKEALVRADVAMLKQVLMNLVKNALEAMENGGRLRIGVDTEGDWLRIDVSDTGPGIPYYQTDKIFDAFFTTKEKGTGLGLPICQRIVADHGGEIRVSSKGFGTTFSVLLPQIGDTAPSSQAAPRAGA